MSHLPAPLNQIWEIIEPTYNYLTELSFLNNSALDWVLVPIFFFSIIIITYIFRFFFLRKLKSLFERRREKGFGVVMVENIQEFLDGSLISIVALYISILHLTIPTNVRFAIDIVFFAILVYQLYRFGTEVIDSGIQYQVRKTDGAGEHIGNFIDLILRSTIIVLLLVWYLSNLGFNIGTFLAGLGIFGLAIAFSLQNILSDLFASVTIYLDKPFEIGDHVIIGDVRGDIEQIGIRSTRIRSIDGHLVVISNQNLLNSEINNYKKMNRRRVTQTLGVHCDTGIKKLRALPEKIENTINQIDKASVVRARLIDLGDSSWNYEIIYNIRSREIGIFKDIKQEVNLQLLELLEREKIGIPYPTQEIILHQ